MEIGFAEKAREEEVRQILVGYNMDLAGDVEEHVILKHDDSVLAAGKLSELDQDYFHLEVFGVRDDKRGTGAGSILLSTMLKNPWQYCLNHEIEPRPRYLVSTVARGEAARFYKKLGFKQCSFPMLVPPYNEQCDTCPDRETCDPIPMLFVGGEDVAACDSGFY